MKLIIDSRMRKEEKEYLKTFGDIIEIPIQSTVYDEISAHPDIFFCKINNTLFKAPNLNVDIGIKGISNIGKEYPEDIKYNVCQIGKFVVHNFRYTDEKVLKYIDEIGLEKINVNQGYSNCSISVISNSACITSDIGIYKALKHKNIDCLLINKDNYNLLDKSGNRTKMDGFIGGATTVINNKFILFGDSRYLSERRRLLDFIEKYNLEFIEFKKFKINDYGGVITIP